MRHAAEPAVFVDAGQNITSLTLSVRGPGWMKISRLLQNLDVTEVAVTQGVVVTETVAQRCPQAIVYI